MNVLEHKVILDEMATVYVALIHNMTNIPIEEIELKLESKRVFTSVEDYGNVLLRLMLFYGVQPTHQTSTELESFPLLSDGFDYVASLYFEKINNNTKK